MRVPHPEKPTVRENSVAPRRRGTSRPESSPAPERGTSPGTTWQALIALAEALSDAVILLDEGGAVLHINQRGRALLGDWTPSATHATERELLRHLSRLDADSDHATEALNHLFAAAPIDGAVTLRARGGKVHDAHVVRLTPPNAAYAVRALILTSRDHAAETLPSSPFRGGSAPAAVVEALVTLLEALRADVETLAHLGRKHDESVTLEHVERLREDTRNLRDAGVSLKVLLGLTSGWLMPEATPKDVDLSDLLMAIMPQWKPRAPLHAFELALSGETPRVPAVESLALDALDILLEAASKWTPQGGVIRVTVRKVGDGVEVAVRPYTAGAYLGPPDAAHAFDPFPSGLELPDTLVRGGAGLSLVRAILEAHGGRIEADAPATGGALTLRVIWPFGVAHAHAPAQRPTDTEGAQATDKLGALPRQGRTTVLLWDPDPRMVRYLRTNLEAHQYRPVVAAGSDELAHLIEVEEPDALITDVGDLAGRAEGLLDSIRALTDAPILLLTNRYDREEAASLLNAGGADYIGKPLNMDELLARLGVALRTRAPAEKAAEAARARVTRTGDLCVDFAQRIVTMAGNEIRLSKTEFKLLRLLAQHLGTVLAHDMLLERVWGAGYRDETDFVWVYVRRLRRKIEPDPAKPRYVLTVPGVGYRLAQLPVAAPEESSAR